jgi:hypothetical protein
VVEILSFRCGTEFSPNTETSSAQTRSALPHSTSVRLCFSIIILQNWSPLPGTYFNTSELETRQKKNVENINLFEFKSSCQRTTNCVMYVQVRTVFWTAICGKVSCMWGSTWHQQLDATELWDLSLGLRNFLWKAWNVRKLPGISQTCQIDRYNCKKHSVLKSTCLSAF